MTVASFLSFAHDRDDLLDRGRVSGASLTFVAWCFAVRNPGIAAASGAGGGIKERLNRSDDSLPREQKRIARRALAPAELAVPPTRLSRLSRVGGDDGGQRADAFWRSGSEAPWLVLVRWGSAALRAGVVCQQPPVGGAHNSAIRWRSRPFSRRGYRNRGQSITLQPERGHRWVAKLTHSQAHAG